MKQWRVALSQEAQDDLSGIHNYIADILREPAIALNQIERIRKAIFSLHEMPERFPLYDGEVWRKKGIRRMDVDNFAVLYKSIRESDIVSIITVIYSGRDIDRVLNEIL